MVWLFATPFSIQNVGIASCLCMSFNLFLAVFWSSIWIACSIHTWNWHLLLVCCPSSSFCRPLQLCNSSPDLFLSQQLILDLKAILVSEPFAASLLQLPSSSSLSFQYPFVILSKLILSLISCLDLIFSLSILILSLLCLDTVPWGHLAVSFPSFHPSLALASLLAAPEVVACFSTFCLYWMSHCIRVLLKFLLAYSSSDG